MIVTALALVTGLLEFYGIMRARGLRPLYWLGIGSEVLFLAAITIATREHPRAIELICRCGLCFFWWPIFLIFLTTAAFFVFICRKTFKQVIDFDSEVLNILVSIFGVLYVGFLGSYLVIFKSFMGSFYLFLLFFITWVYDSAAYLCGTIFGKHHPWPAISPKKTTEGLIGGIILTVVSVLILRVVAQNEFTLSFSHCVILAVLLSLASQTGDLTESVFKRWAGVKDSSAIIPGHGGILDKIDGLLFTAPVMFWYLIYLMIFMKI